MTPDLLPDGDVVPAYAELSELGGRRFVVLGGGQGIGRQVVHALTQLGAEVELIDRDDGRARQVAEEIGPAVRPQALDVTDRAAMERLGATIGPIDGVIDIVGMARYGRLLDLTDETWAWEHDVVLRHAWLALQCLAPRIAERGGGAFAFVASLSGLTSAPLHAAYGAFKAALMSLVRSAAVELGPDRIRVNAVAPGTVWTPRVAELLGPAGHAKSVAAAPLRRVALPSDVAAGLLFLVSDQAAAITGHTIVLDGGASARFAYEVDR
ncbi:SDR family NAD(P)-dependent oxidoreductase [Cryptosporangium minutisporangium]|uniref:SDR family oxidoreductase n=1 Tax=Cryptosporangium minutisporangium TaxID=113569 RepID=A0ABP6SS20_9ACTN